jgi:hypothetical protein
MKPLFCKGFDPLSSRMSAIIVKDNSFEEIQHFQDITHMRFRNVQGYQAFPATGQTYCLFHNKLRMIGKISSNL